MNMTDSTSSEAAAPYPGLPARIALSPSRASDYKQCPLLFRFRTIDRIPTRPSEAAVRGTLVHQVLEDLFDSPRSERNLELACKLLEPAWAKVLKQSPDSVYVVQPDAKFVPGAAATNVTASPVEVAAWAETAVTLLESYFEVEDPTRLEPEARELWLEVRSEGGTPLRGIVDRLDVAPDGRMRVVDYKSGKAPNPRFQDKALFQMRFYALMLLRTRGSLPARLQLVYLKSKSLLTSDPTESEIAKFETEVDQLWGEITRAAVERDFEPKTSRLCDWCDFRALCPAQGGELPDYPEID